MLDEKRNNISKILEYPDEKYVSKQLKYIIIGNDDILTNLKNNNINQYFMDCTYKVFPPNIYKLRLMVISGFNFNLKKTVLCCSILLPHENEYKFKYHN